MNKGHSIIILVFLLSSRSGADQIGTELAQLEVSLSSLRKLLPQQAPQPSADMSFGKFLTTLTMRSLGVSSTDSPLIINQNKFDNNRGYYQVRVLDQGGLQCGWHAIKNIFWFLNALSTTIPQEQITSLANLQKQSVYDPFYTLISQAMGGCPRGMLTTQNIAQVISYICFGLYARDIPSAASLDSLKSQSHVNYQAICADLASTVVTFYKEGLDPEIPTRKEYIESIEQTITNIIQRSSAIEGRNWLALSEKTYKQALEVLALFSDIQFYSKLGQLPKWTNFEEFEKFKTRETASLGYIVLLPGGINHYVAIAAYKKNNISEYFLLNSINNGYLESAYKNIESLSSLLNLSLEEFKKTLLRFFMEYYALDLSDEQLQKITPLLEETLEEILARAEAGTVRTPTNYEMFKFMLDRAVGLVGAIRSYKLHDLDLYKTIYLPWILKNLDALKNKINTSIDLSKDQKSALIARAEQYINSFATAGIEINDDDIEISD